MTSRSPQKGPKPSSLSRSSKRADNVVDSSYALTTSPRLLSKVSSGSDMSHRPQERSYSPNIPLSPNETIPEPAVVVSLGGRRPTTPIAQPRQSAAILEHRRPNSPYRGAGSFGSNNVLNNGSYNSAPDQQQQQQPPSLGASVNNRASGRTSGNGSMSVPRPSSLGQNPTQSAQPVAAVLSQSPPRSVSFATGAHPAPFATLTAGSASQNHFMMASPTVSPWNKPLSRRSTLIFIAFMTTAIICFAAAIAMPQIRVMAIKYFVTISSESSPLYTVWADPKSRDIEMFRKFTVFNLTNAEEVLAGKSAPSYELLGPYCYHEETVKYDIRFGKNSNHAYYKYRNTFHFDADCSVWENSSKTNLYGPAIAPPYGNVSQPFYSENDEIVVPSIGVIGLFYRLGYLPDTLPNLTKADVCSLMNLVLSGNPIGPTSVFMKLKVKDLLFGYQDSILSTAKMLVTGKGYDMPTNMMLEWNGTYPVPSPYSFRSGQQCPLFENTTFMCNTTLNQETSELTGIGNYKAMGVLTQWAGQRQTWWWGSRIDGYDGGTEPGNGSPTPGVSPDEDDMYPSNDTSRECPLDLGYEVVPIDDDDNEVHPTHDPKKKNWDDERHVAHHIISTGTNGMKFGPIDAVRKDRQLAIYGDFMWRSFAFDYVADDNYMGVDTYRFHVSPSGFSAEESNTKCYQQYYDGLLNISQPMFAPCFGARGFFNGLDPLTPRRTVGDGGDGQKRLINITMRVPSSGQWNASAASNYADFSHLDINDYINTFINSPTDGTVGGQAALEPFVEVDPITGLTMDISFGGILFSELKPLAVDGCPNVNFAVGANLPTTLVPYMLVQKSASMPPNVVAELKQKLEQIEDLKVTLWVVGSVGIAGCCLVVFISLTYRWRAAKALEADEDYAGPLLKEEQVAGESILKCKHKMRSGANIK